MRRPPQVAGLSNKLRPTSLFSALAIALLTLLACQDKPRENTPSGDTRPHDVSKDMSATDDYEELPCGVGDDEKWLPAPGMRPFIVNGHRQHDPEVAPLSSGQINAIVALLERRRAPAGGHNWEITCTATLVDEFMAVTAAHCVSHIIDLDDLELRLGPDTAHPAHRLGVSEIIISPGYVESWGADQARNDIALLRLDDSASTESLELTFIPLNLEPLPDSFVGQRVQNVGFGATSPLDWEVAHNTRRWWTVTMVVRADSYQFVVSGGGESAVCFGDSGGPALWTFPDGTVRIAGILSWGDVTCLDDDHFARTDHETTWLRALLQDTDYCGATTARGRCDGPRAVRCHRSSGGDEATGRLVVEDCRAKGWVCEYDGDEYPSAVCHPGSCDEQRTWIGRCTDNHVAEWCERGEPRRRRCLPCGQRCEFDDDGLGFYCR